MKQSPTDRLRSLNARIVNLSAKTAVDPNRIRRQVAFQRFLDRTAESGLILKGGYCLEIRLPQSARSTQDLDFVTREALTTEDAVLDEVERHIAGQHPDGFTFLAQTATLLRAADEPAAAWRVGVETLVDGHFFIRLKLDLVSQFAEAADAVEVLDVPPVLSDPNFTVARVPAVDVYQHAAEKFHAMGRLYSGARPSSRVKDLVDLALLADAGLLGDPARLATRIRAVHRARDGEAPPAVLPSPPADWESRYAALAGGLPPALGTAHQAFAHVHELYQRALAIPEA